MRVMKAVSALVMLVLVGVVATVEADDKKAAPPLIDWATTMPSIELSHQPLEKVLQEMKVKLPGFDFSISRQNVPHDYPVLPEMTLENVTLFQFMELLAKQVPGSTINNGDHYNSSASFWHVDVAPDPNAPLPPSPVVRVFGLSDTFAGPEILKGNADIEKHGIDDALSLIQAALDVGGETPSAVLKVHAPTKSLIFKGTAAQADIVANAIAVLQASAKSRIYDPGTSGASKEVEAILKNHKDAATQPSK